MAGWNTKSFADYKRDISLSRFIQDHGYSSQTAWARSKSSRAIPCYENPAKDRIYLFSSPSGEKYFDIARNKSGDLVDFIRDRLGDLFISAAGQNEIASTFQVLAAYEGNGGLRASTREAVPPALPPPLDKKYKPELFKLLPLTDRSYLYSQGITDETLDSPHFKGAIYNVLNPKMVNGRQEGHHPFKSVAFPIYAALGGEIIGLEERNANFKGYGLTSESGRGVWMSSPPPLVEQLILHESAKDALSHYQLFRPPGALYLSTGGAIAKGQLQTILSLIESLRHPGFSVRMAFDRDLAGAEFDTRLLLSLAAPGQPRLTPLSTPATEPYRFNIPSLVTDAAQEPHLKRAASSAPLRATNPIAEQFEPENSGIRMKEGAAGWEVTVPRNLDALMQFNQLLLKAMAFTVPLSLEKANQKDHNDDLKALLPVRPARALRSHP